MGERLNCIFVVYLLMHLMVNGDFHYVVKNDGLTSNQCDEKEPYADCTTQVVPDDSEFPIRCCSYTETKMWIFNDEIDGCENIWHESLDCTTGSYNKATERCHQLEGTLCTVAEIERGCIIHVGCNFENRLVWAIDAGDPNDNPVNRASTNITPTSNTPTPNTPAPKTPTPNTRSHSSTPHNSVQYDTYKDTESDINKQIVNIDAQLASLELSKTAREKLEIQKQKLMEALKLTLTKIVDLTEKNTDEGMEIVEMANNEAKLLSAEASLLKSALGRTKMHVESLQNKVGKVCNDYQKEHICDEHLHEGCTWDITKCVSKKCAEFSQLKCDGTVNCYYEEGGCHESFKSPCINEADTNICQAVPGNPSTGEPGCIWIERAFQKCQFECNGSIIGEDSDECERYFGCAWNNDRCDFDRCENYQTDYRACLTAPSDTLGGCGFQDSTKSCSACNTANDQFECQQKYGCKWNDNAVCIIGFIECTDLKTAKDCNDTQKNFPKGNKCEWNHRNLCIKLKEEKLFETRQLPDLKLKSRATRFRE